MPQHSKMFSFKLVGAEQLADNLMQLPLSVQKVTLQKGCIKALAPTLTAAQGLAASVVKPRTGRYAKSFIVSPRLNKSQAGKERKLVAAGLAEKYLAEVHVGSTDPKAHLLEFGHLDRAGGSVRAFPVMRPAWDQTKDKVLNILSAELWNALAAAARSLRTKAESGTLSAKQTSFFLS